MTIIPISAFLAVALALFAIGLVGVVARRNLLIQLMGIELMLNAANLVLITASRYRGDESGQVLALLVMAVAAGEAAVGLALVIAFFRHRREINSDRADALKH
jgi:NADH-quinone oxidoreductase subunit K